MQCLLLVILPEHHWRQSQRRFAHYRTPGMGEDFIMMTLDKLEFIFQDLPSAVWPIPFVTFINISQKQSVGKKLRR